MFSVPFDIGDTRPTLVTASHAIFKEENGQKAPAAVVGVQIDYDKFEKNFMKVTTGAEGHGYMVRTTFQSTYISFLFLLQTNSGEFLSCKNESIECYVLDNNGFVLISEDPLNTGKFFGEVDGTILRSLEKNHVFKKVKIYDYQAVCLENVVSLGNADEGSPAGTILTPFQMMSWLFNWLIGSIAMTIIRLEIHHLWNPDWTWALPAPQEREREVNKTRPTPCDKETYLYHLDETALQLERPLQGIIRNCHESSCERPFSVTLIPNTNLVLVVADKMCPCSSAKISVAPTKVAYDEPENESASNYCEKLKSNLYRRKPRGVVVYHPEVRGPASLLLSPFMKVIQNPKPPPKKLS